MFLLVSVRHVDAHPGGYQHGVSIQISINLGKKFLRISRIRNILLAWILPRNMVYLHPFISQIPDLIYWTVLIFILICFEWRDTENQQYFPRCTAGPNIVAIGHFRVPSGLCFKRRVGAQPLIWKSLFHPHANKTHFHKKGCAPRLILKVRVFGTRKWLIGRCCIRFNSTANKDKTTPNIVGLARSLGQNWLVEMVKVVNDVFTLASNFPGPNNYFK